MVPEAVNGKPVLDVAGLAKTYQGRGRVVEAIHHITFSLAAGELVCVVGPSGCGKTTLLRCIAGLLAPSAGEVRLEGQLVTGPPPGLAMVFQDYGRSLFPWMTISANVELPLRQKRVPRERRLELVRGALAAVHLDGTHAAYPWQLSGGMQQRVAIARAIAYEPRVLLMDEPFAAVDAQTRADLEDLIRSIWQEYRVTTLFVTHDIDEAVYLGERVLVLSGPPTVVMAELGVDLPDRRDQLTTRADPRFTQLRGTVYGLVQAAKRGDRPIRPW
ncbi:MAG TPA: ABC transporter ATP-binding protein [Rugosimonospora sp.]|nr:ABC transporter ATP-binding protein [Rugosimonospora sp.]